MLRLKLNPSVRVGFSRVATAPNLPILRITVAQVTAVVSLLLGFGVWQIHKPGIANHDGVWMYSQGIGITPFSDLQPVYISVVVSWLVAIGLKFWHLTLIQSMLVSLGVQRVATGAVKTAAGLPDRSAHAIGLMTLTLLLTPFTPLAWYLVYFGSDGWLQTAFLWYAALWLGSFRRFPEAGRAERIARAAGLTALGGASILIRPNAVVLIPLFGVMLAVLHGRDRWRTALVWCFVLLAVRPVAGFLIYNCYTIEKSPPGDPVMAHDLVGIAIIRPEALAEMPFTAAHLDGDQYRTGAWWVSNPIYPWGETGTPRDSNPRYIFGVVDTLFPWGHKPIVKPGYVIGAHDQLAAEYWKTVRKYPGTLAVVKARAFMSHILNADHYWHNIEVDPNAAGLAHKPNHRPLLRGLHLAVDHQLWADPVLRWVSGRHLLWFVLTVVMVAGLGYALAYRPSRPTAALFLLMLMPLGYYLSYTLAMNGAPFRFMYPATLLVEAVLVGLGVNLVRRWFADAADRMAA
jgi:hypothetical protein